ncbi:MAG: hypothetical protein JO186_06255 [Actinobacteria bacterium]|nr:hypothetical protein [Actinomycetota bacterium]
MGLRTIGITTLALLALAPAAHARGFAVVFGERSYRPGQIAWLHVLGGPASLYRATLLRAGAGADDRPTAGLALAPPRPIVHAAGSFEIPFSLGDFPSGVYFARVEAVGVGVRYAPLVLRPRRLGAAPVLVVVPTNTWQAYDFWGGDSWYLDAGVHVVDLRRPYTGNGLPPHFRGYDLGFLRWYAANGGPADFVSDDDLERFVGGAQLRHLYRLVVFPGHEEYVTAHLYDLLDEFRARGGNIAFLSADNVFYAVERIGNDLVGRTRWRDLGRPEAALVGAQYAGWDERTYANRPYVVARPSWVFGGTTLRDGSRFGKYGIEIDEVTAASPPHTLVLARIPNEFGAGVDAEMTLYRMGASTVFDAGAMNFGGSADWPLVSRIVDNLWTHLSGEGVLAASYAGRMRNVPISRPYTRVRPTNPSAAGSSTSTNPWNGAR